jgi:hypothetical protein
VRLTHPVGLTPLGTCTHLQELSENMGLKKLRDRFMDESYGPAMLGLFPKDNPKNTRFAINFFTSIGLGALTYVCAPLQPQRCFL